MEGRNGYEVYVEKKKKMMKTEKKKKKKDMVWYFSRFAQNYLKGKDAHVGRDCRIWRIRLFL